MRTSFAVNLENRLQKTITDLLRDPEIIREKSAHAIERINVDHSEDNYSEALMDLYNKALNLEPAESLAK